MRKGKRKKEWMLTVTSSDSDWSSADSAKGVSRFRRSNGIRISFVSNKYLVTPCYGRKSDWSLLNMIDTFMTVHGAYWIWTGDFYRVKVALYPWANTPKNMGPLGFEPRTNRLWADCSNHWAMGPNERRIILSNFPDGKIITQQRQFSKQKPQRKLGSHNRTEAIIENTKL